MSTEVSKAQQVEDFCVPDTLESLENRNQYLETRIRELEGELRLKDDALRQNGLLGMGDLVGSLAHQWLQPLNNICLIVQGLQLAFKTHDLSVEEMNSDVSEIMREIQQITDTISKFRNSFSRE